MNEKPFSAKRWTDIPKPKATGEKNPNWTQEKADQATEEMLRYYGILKDDEPYDKEKFEEVKR